MFVLATIEWTAKLVSVIALAILLSAPAQAATIYNAATDFSLTNNGTNGNPWSYGIDTATTDGGTTPDPSSFSKLTQGADGDTAFPTPGHTYAGLDVWKNGGTDPNIIFNPTANTITDGSNTWLAGELTEGPFNGPTVVRFTAPSAGQYLVNADFTPAQNGVNSAPTAFVYHNSTLLGSGSATGFPYTGTVTLAANDTLDFISWGANAHNLTTRLEATITPVPEPATLALFGLGGLALLLAARLR